MISRAATLDAPVRRRAAQKRASDRTDEKEAKKKLFNQSAHPVGYRARYKSIVQEKHFENRVRNKKNEGKRVTMNDERARCMRANSV